MLSPIVIFAWRRPKLFLQTIDSLSRCFLFKESDVFVFIDGPRHDKDNILIEETYKIAQKIKSRKLEIIRRDRNFGLKNNIKMGVGEVISKYGRAIVVEEDLIFARDFLVFMNKALEHYSDIQDVFSVTGYCPKINIPEDYKYSVFFFFRVSSWGWGTWERVWKGFESFELSRSHIESVINDPMEFHRFCAGGYDLKDIALNALNKSWAIEFQYYHYLSSSLCVYPIRTKLKHMGFREGENIGFQRIKFSDFPFDPEFCESNYSFPSKIFVDWRIFCEFHKHINDVIRPPSLYEKILFYLSELRVRPVWVFRKLKNKVLRKDKNNDKK